MEGQQANASKEPGITISYLTTEFRPEVIKQDKEGHFITLKDTIHSEDIADINYSPNKQQTLWFVVDFFPPTKQKLRHAKRNRNTPTIGAIIHHSQDTIDQGNKKRKVVVKDLNKRTVRKFYE